ncbi:MAG TPA: Rieske 2Fe-2S domain-containing protein [Polyangiaceae bacterium]|jgi:nitrite reductase (NADH) small subunit|nr:Rieske 2Fe-2S domain-containing protein [Polyangiaceae bacterium]
MPVTLGPLAAIPEGEGRCFEVGATKLAVFRARNGRIFATDARCPHRGGPLADGLLGGHTLVCPLHSLRFDLETGLASDGATRLKIYPAALGPTGNIVVELDVDDGERALTDRGAA